MKTRTIRNTLVITALFVTSTAGAASNAYYRAECETADGVTHLANLVKVQKTGGVTVPGTWTVLVKRFILKKYALSK